MVVAQDLEQVNTEEHELEITSNINDNQPKEEEMPAAVSMQPNERIPRIREAFHMDVSELIVYFEHTPQADKSA